MCGTDETSKVIIADCKRRGIGRATGAALHIAVSRKTRSQRAGCRLLYLLVLWLKVVCAPRGGRMPVDWGTGRRDVLFSLLGMASEFVRPTLLAVVAVSYHIEGEPKPSGRGG